MQIGFTKADTDTVKEGAFLDGHEGRGVGGQCLFPREWEKGCYCCWLCPGLG